MVSIAIIMTATATRAPSAPLQESVATVNHGFIRQFLHQFRLGAANPCQKMLMGVIEFFKAINAAEKLAVNLRESFLVTG